MARSSVQPDVLVLGSHPAAYLAAALLRRKSRLCVVHVTIPGEQLGERLVLVNPALFGVHPLLEGLRRKIEAKAVYGLQFLADDRGAVAEYRSKTLASLVAQLKDVRSAMCELARAQGVEFLVGKGLEIHRLDERGIEVTVGGQTMRPRAMVLSGRLTGEQHRLLGVPEEWERGVVHRYTYARLRATKWVDLGSRPLVPMSLDLRGTLSWAWLLPSDRLIQVAVEQPVQMLPTVAPAELLRHWVSVLHRHGVLHAPIELADEQIESIDIPFEGALAHEGLANRTLLVGPAGGFYTGSGEDVYPNCWSAVFAADVLKKAWKEPHLQDALQPYRQRWRTTLGDYLRGPQRNLRFLLPLVYRNQIMTNRLAEAILMGRSVVR